MKAQGATLLAAASLLAGLAAASAQTQSPGAGSSAGATHSQDQCWDATLNQVRRQQSAKTSTESQGGATAGSGTTGAAGTSAAGEPKSGAAGGSSTAATRPAGMPNC